MEQRGEIAGNDAYLYRVVEIYFWNFLITYRNSDSCITISVGVLGPASNVRR
jgi:hypothetical protein